MLPACVLSAVVTAVVRVAGVKMWDEDEAWAEKAIRKYNRRSGIRRLYCFPGKMDEKGYLKLEFVLRGRVLFTLRLWEIPSLDERRKRHDKEEA